MRQNQQTSQTFVMLAMGLVTGAVAIALYQHAGLPGPVAATTALAVYVVLLTAHAVLWRGRGGSMSFARDRRKKEVKRLAGEQKRAQPAAGLSGLSLGAGRGTAAELSPAPILPKPQRSGKEVAAASRPQAGPILGPAPQPQHLAPPPMPQLPPLNKDTRPAAAQASDGDMWSYRPAAPRLDLPPFVTGRTSGRGQAPAAGGAHAQGGRPEANTLPPMPPPLPALGRGPREADVEVIQDAIKRLLEEVNAAEAQAAQQTRMEDEAASAGAQTHMPGEQLEYSVDALKMAAQAMRVAGHKAEAMPPPVPQTMPDLPPYVTQPQQWAGQAVHPSHSRAQLLSDAIKAGRIDVRLEPILGLEDQQTRHYEVSVRLRDATGAPMDVNGSGPDLRGTGLLPLFDSVRVTRTAAVARRLEERGKSGSIFSSFNGESVVDEGFLGELAETLHQRASLAAQLVLSFTQNDVRGFAAAEWDSLADMRALGFRFALSDITDLDMDFEALAEQGFAFVKLDADVFLRGLPTANGVIPSSDVCRHLAKLGLTLVVEHIDNEDKLARIFGFGVLLGQGQLFGGPRPVRSDVVSASGTAAA
jgi:cyclic-di-GMP phosphodiesterase TipF (flagellum assembly factor)